MTPQFAPHVSNLCAVVPASYRHKSNRLAVSQFEFEMFGGLLLIHMLLPGGPPAERRVFLGASFDNSVSLSL